MLKFNLGYKYLVDFFSHEFHNTTDYKINNVCDINKPQYSEAHEMDRVFHRHLYYRLYSSENNGKSLNKKRGSE